MEALLLFGPGLAGLLALILAFRLLLPPRREPQSAARLVGSFVLALAAFGIGTCYAAVFSGFGSRAREQIAAVGTVALLLLAAMTAFYAVRLHQLPTPDTRLHEAFEVGPSASRPPRLLAAAILGVLAVLAGLAVAMMLL